MSVGADDYSGYRPSKHPKEHVREARAAIQGWQKSQLSAGELAWAVYFLCKLGGTIRRLNGSIVLREIEHGKDAAATVYALPRAARTVAHVIRITLPSAAPMATATISERTGLSYPEVTTALDQLRAHGLLQVHRSGDGWALDTSIRYSIKAPSQGSTENPREIYGGM